MVYIEKIPIYEVEGDFSKVCFLHQALYGLKQSLRRGSPSSTDSYVRKGSLHVKWTPLSFSVLPLSEALQVVIS